MFTDTLKGCGRDACSSCNKPSFLPVCHLPAGKDRLTLDWEGTAYPVTPCVESRTEICITERAALSVRLNTKSDAAMSKPQHAVVEAVLSGAVARTRSRDCWGVADDDGDNFPRSVHSIGKTRNRLPVLVWIRSEMYLQAVVNRSLPWNFTVASYEAQVDRRERRWRIVYLQRTATISKLDAVDVLGIECVLVQMKKWTDTRKG